jgi:hypothetical protein
MGTKAVFAVSGEGESILGMTSDGFPENLEYIAGLFVGIARQLHVIRKVKAREPDTIKRIFEIIEKHTDSWAFQDSIKNACWVSYSARLFLANFTLQHYEGDIRDGYRVSVPVNVIANLKAAKKAIKKTTIAT